MDAESRTKKTLRNVRTALAFYFLALGANFFSRKVFIENLGAEFLGLNTTAANLLGFLNLADLGISAAIAVTLYKPLFEKDRRSVNEILSIQGWFYRRVAVVVGAGAVVLSLFFPLIFSEMTLPLPYAYGTFGVLLFGSLAGYLFNYRQIALTADQKDYKVTFCTQGTKLVKTTVQIFAVAYLSNGYLWWLALELVFGAAQVLLLSATIRREYPWLRPDVSRGNALRKLHPQIMTKTAQVFFHRIGGFALFQAIPLVIFAFTSLSLVAVYGNYVLIASAVSAMLAAVFNSFTAGVGNLISEGDRERVLRVFWEYATARYWIAGTACFSMAMLATPFISLWVGADYVLPAFPFGLLLAYYFIQFTRVSDTFLGAYGLFQDIAAPIVEAALSIGCSVLFGWTWGLSGILSGILVSQLAVIVCWKPYFLFTRGFKKSVFEYVVKTVCLFGLLGLAAVVSWAAAERILALHFSTWFDWGFSAAKVSLTYAVVSASVFAVVSSSFRRFVARIANFAFPRLRNHRMGGGYTAAQVAFPQSLFFNSSKLAAVVPSAGFFAHRRLA